MTNMKDFKDTIETRGWGLMDKQRKKVMQFCFIYIRYKIVLIN